MYLLVKKLFNSQGAKLQILHKNSTMKLINQNCHYPIFLPFMITLSETNTHSYAIEHLSTNFVPDSSFLKIINQAKSPFEMKPNKLKE